MTEQGTHGGGTLTRAGMVVVALCWAAVVGDGFDIVLYGAVLPVLLEGGVWGLTPATAGVLGAVPLIGMAVGSLVAGSLADRVGRRRMLIGCVVLFSVTTALCALAPSLVVFGGLRFVAGIGLGGLVPLTSAITAEFTPARYRNRVFAMMFCGLPFGAVAAALLGLVVIPAVGWRPMFALAIVPMLVVVPLALRFLPESVLVLRRRGREAEADEVARRFGLGPAVTPPGAPAAGAPMTGAPTGELFGRRYLPTMVCFALVCALCLFMIYGVNTWMPQIMRQAGYSLGGAITFLLVFNAGSAVGAVLVSFAADRLGTKPALGAMLSLAALCVAGVSLQPPTAVMYVLIGLAGVGAISSQSLLLALLADSLPARLTAPGMGLTMGIGRIGSISAPIVLGLVLSAGYGLQVSFLALAAAGVVGSALIVLIPRPAPEPAVTSVHAA